MPISNHEKPIRGQTNNWFTPNWIIDLLGTFDLDPCGHPLQSSITADVIICPPLDGLDMEWEGCCFVNPPYGSEVAVWVEKLADHNNGVLLIFARTDTKWFQKHIFEKAEAIFFLKGRVKFESHECKYTHSNAGAPSCFVAYGPEALQRLKDIDPIYGKLCYL